MDEAMLHPLAFCPVHGLFPATAFAFAGEMQEVRFNNVSVNCPQCGRMAEVIPGRYDSVLGRLSVIVDPSVSQDALAALRGIAERLQREEITPNEAAAEAEKIDPSFARSLVVAAKIGAWAIPVIISLITLYLMIKDSKSSGEQAAAVLQALQSQVAVLERIETELGEEQPQQTEGSDPSPSQQHAKPEPAPEKEASERRQMVNGARRGALKERWHQFGRSRHH
jgi:hypothetical protein